MKDVSKNYLIVQGWMIKSLNLSGNDLLAFSLIYGFSQDGESMFNGSISYICQWLNCSRPTATKAIANLLNKKLISKEEISFNSVKFNAYKANLKTIESMLSGSKESLQGGKESLHGCKETLQGCKETLQGCKESLHGCKESLHNNIDYNIVYNIDNNIDNNNINNISSNSNKDTVYYPVHEQQQIKNSTEPPKTKIDNSIPDIYTSYRRMLEDENAHKHFYAYYPTSDKQHFEKLLVDFFKNVKEKQCYGDYRNYNDIVIHFRNWLPREKKRRKEINPPKTNGEKSFSLAKTVNIANRLSS